jgi:hypothetical protein
METNYAFWVDWLFSRFPAYQNLGAQAYKPGLERVISLLENTEYPYCRYKWQR